MSASKPKLSLAMIVKNEARSVRGILDEIIIADTGSTDGTIEIAGECGANISHFNWTGDFSAARNFALYQTTGDWILVLNADEFASNALAKEIGEFVQTPPAIGRLKIVSDFRRTARRCVPKVLSRDCSRAAHVFKAAFTSKLFRRCSASICAVSYGTTVISKLKSPDAMSNCYWPNWSANRPMASALPACHRIHFAGPAGKHVPVFAKSIRRDEK